MNEKELNTKLYQKLLAEQELYRHYLMNQTPSEILKHAYEYSVREDILMSLEYNDLSDQQAVAFLKSSNILDDVFQAFEDRETNYMDIILDCIVSQANILLQQEQEAKLELQQLPDYDLSLEYAYQYDDYKLYQDSYKANIACRLAIEKYISDHYHENKLKTDEIKQVVEQFGYGRIFFVLANTIEGKMQDGRISKSNKDWARGFTSLQQFNYTSDPEFIVDRCNPGLIDLFLTKVRHEYLLTLPITKEEIKREAKRILKDCNKSLNRVSLSDKLKVKTIRNTASKQKEEKKNERER